MSIGQKVIWATVVLNQVTRGALTQWLAIVWVTYHWHSRDLSQTHPGLRCLDLTKRRIDVFEYSSNSSLRLQATKPSLREANSFRKCFRVPHCFFPLIACLPHRLIQTNGERCMSGWPKFGVDLELHDSITPISKFRLSQITGCQLPITSTAAAMNSSGKTVREWVELASYSKSERAVITFCFITLVIRTTAGTLVMTPISFLLQNGERNHLNTVKGKVLYSSSNYILRRIVAPRADVSTVRFSYNTV